MSENEIIISMKEVLQQKKYFAPLYLKFHGGKLICVQSHGADSSFERLKHYNDHGVHFLYIKPEHRNLLLSSGYTAGGLPFGKSWVMKDSNQKVLEKLWQTFPERTQAKPLVLKNQDQFKDIYTTVLTAIQSDEIFAPSLEKMIQEDQPLMVHSFDTFQLAMLLLKALGKELSESYLTCGVLSLLHDLGKMTVPADIRSKNPDILDENARKIFCSHTESLALMASRHPTMSQNLKKMFQTFDAIEREGKQYPLLENEELWCMILAHRITGKQDAKIDPFTFANVKDFFTTVTSEDLAVPESVLKELKSQAMPYLRRAV